MIYLLLFFTAIAISYLMLIFMIMKMTIIWRYKVLVYGGLTFFMLTGIFILFGIYDKYWK